MVRINVLTLPQLFIIDVKQKIKQVTVKPVLSDHPFR